MMQKRIILFLLVFLSIELLSLENSHEMTVREEWITTIEHSLQKKNRFNLPTEKVLESVERQIIRDFGSFEAFDKGFKKRSIRHVIGYLKILHIAKKQLLEEKWKEEDLI
ncbi:MAG: hypothetical protein S4CHLAM7_02120 [Chlamydiae bacterium]|nr:hypothetical protein [Chlamydiota bacterium]